MVKIFIPSACRGELSDLACSESDQVLAKRGLKFPKTIAIAIFLIFRKKKDLYEIRVFFSLQKSLNRCAN